MTLPKGYDTEVGELGDTLSGGEKQRIGIARAFLHDAPMILMDEPTSNLDSLNEGIILKSLKESSKQKIEEGIQNWAKATIGIDDSFSDDTKKVTDEKLYEIITSDKEREKIKQQREEFYKDSKIQTDNITVEIKKASEALYNERTIGYVEAKVTVEGKRNDDSFTNKYDLVLLMDYQEDVASVYEVVDIKTE